jgi:Ser/Thr protein kinase RdoA (MazF antagonist)
MDPQSCPDFVPHCLRAYDIGELREVQAFGGTAGKTWRVTTDRGAWLLRLRGCRTSSDELIAFDHGLRQHLLGRRIPTAAPVRTRDGRTFVRIDGSALELYAFINGIGMRDSHSRHIVAEASRTLAHLHRASASYPAAQALPPVAQYASLGVPDTSDRMEEPALLARVYAQFLSHAGACAYADAVQTAAHWLNRLNTDFDRNAFDALPHTVTHGDFTLANLLFSEHGRLIGVFDYDWARWAPRVRDIADGMFFIGGRRRTPLRADDIWSLTEAAELTVDRCALWLREYRDIGALAAAEFEAIPLAFAARWLSVRAEGTAKVAPDDRLRFCFGNLVEPLAWFEANWPAVLALV